MLIILNLYFFPGCTETTANGPAEGLALLRPRPLINVVSGVLIDLREHESKVLA